MSDKEYLKSILSMNSLTIKTKEECYALYEAGFFGNKPLTWNSYEEILKSEWTGKVCMRSRKGISRKNVRYNIPLEKVPREIKKWEELGVSPEAIAFNQAMPDEHLLIQGEVTNLDWRDGRIYLLYSTFKKPMNIALMEESHHARGLTARLLLKKNMFPSSYLDMEALLERFPDHAIEFSTYSIEVGNIPNRNMIIWEIRKY